MSMALLTLLNNWVKYKWIKSVYFWQIGIISWFFKRVIYLLKTYLVVDMLQEYFYNNSVANRTPRSQNFSFTISATLVLGAFCDPPQNNERIGRTKESNFGWKKRSPVRLSSFFDNPKERFLEENSHFSFNEGQKLPSENIKFDLMKRQRPPSVGILQEVQKRQRPPSRMSHDVKRQPNDKPLPPGLHRMQGTVKPRPPRDVISNSTKDKDHLSWTFHFQRRQTSFDVMKRQRLHSEGILQEEQKRQRPPSSNIDFVESRLQKRQRPLARRQPGTPDDRDKPLPPWLQKRLRTRKTEIPIQKTNITSRTDFWTSPGKNTATFFCSV